MTQNLYFSHGKEHDGSQFLQIAVSIAKLWPYKIFMKCIFVLSFYNALYWWTIMPDLHKLGHILLIL